MVWFNVDDNLHDHPKARRAGLEAIGLWALCGSFSAGYLTEGFVPEWKVLGYKNGRKLAEKLVEAGLWIEVYEDPKNGQEAGWVFHQWEDRNRTKAQVEQERAANRARQAKRRAGKSHGVTPPVSHSGSNGVSHRSLAVPSQAKPSNYKRVTSIDG